jgi:hypothetical protein
MAVGSAVEAPRRWVLPNIKANLADLAPRSITYKLDMKAAGSVRNKNRIEKSFVSGRETNDVRRSRTSSPSPSRLELVSLPLLLLRFPSLFSIFYFLSYFSFSYIFLPRRSLPLLLSPHGPSR